ncbi:alpha/beta fold hydrolase [Amycolatopsis mediterranei]|uniref:alpha/beta fold hydrolase n=1 Tax=Amycolatopsis mediterranei TaxID=33910 RepID=UPI00361CE0D8
MDSTRALAAAYVGLLDELGLGDVTVIGNSLGGRPAEIALPGSPRVSGVVIVDGIGIEVEGRPVTSVAGLAPVGLRKLFLPQPQQGAGDRAGPGHPGAAVLHRPGHVRPDPAGPAPHARPPARPRHLGESDGIVSTEYGQASAAAIPTAKFTVLPRSGHLPRVETPEELLHPGRPYPPKPQACPISRCLFRTPLRALIGRAPAGKRVPASGSRAFSS